MFPMIYLSKYCVSARTAKLYCHLHRTCCTAPAPALPCTWSWVSGHGGL